MVQDELRQRRRHVLLRPQSGAHVHTEVRGRELRRHMEPVEQVALAAAENGRVHREHERGAPGAFGASLGTQFGREALPKVALGVGGYELEQSAEDPRLKATGQGLQLLSMASLGYRPSKAAIRSGAINVRDALAQSPQGRTALNLISRDILIDPKVKGVVELAEREMAKYRAIGLDLARQARKLGPQGDRLVSDIVENERIESRAGMDDETMKAAMAVAQKVAQEVSGLGREKVATGIISKETYDRRMSSYLKRFYAAFKGAEAMQPVTIRKGNKIFRIEPERVRNENLSLEERNALGEIREASVRLGETFTEGGRNIATSRLFNALAGIDGVIPPVYKQAMDEADERPTALRGGIRQRGRGDGQGSTKRRA